MQKLLKFGFVFTLLWVLLSAGILTVATQVEVGVIVLAVLAAQLAVLLIVGLKLTRQIRWSTDETERNLKQVYWQLESMQYVLAEVKPKGPLPAAREWALSPDALKVLVQMIREHKPKLVLEAGSGISTIVTAYLLKQQGGGKVISLDQDEDYGARTRDLLKQHGLSKYAEIRIAPLGTHEIEGKTWPWYDRSTWKDLGKIDLMTIDGPIAKLSPMARWPAVPLLKDKLKPDAVILLDDADRPDERQMVVEWQEMLTGSSHDYVYTEKGLSVISRKPRKFGISV